MTKNSRQSALELDKILKMLIELCGCDGSRAMAENLAPSDNYDEVAHSMQKTSDAHALAMRYGSPSVSGLADCGELLARATVGSRLAPAELLDIARTLRAIRLLLEWRRQDTDTETVLDGLFEALSTNRPLEDDITTAILSEEEIADRASPALYDIRRKMVRAGQSIREQLDKMIRSTHYQKFLQEQLITQRDGRYVVPVKAEYKNEVKGLVHDTSGSGATFFIEPMAVVEANNEIRQLQAAEREEIDRILLELSGKAGEFARPMVDGYEAAVELDFYFAKARLGRQMRATLPTLDSEGGILLKKARHPLIPSDKIVPVDISLGIDFDTLVITGPNTGGKTVALKTLGLMTVMAACGLMLPVEEGSRVSVFGAVLADIGDEQSIEQSLSTFSGHIANIIEILGQADQNSLVLLDELGAGTDPVEGAALAVAILEELRRRGVKVAATTHYAEIKMYALQTEGVENGCCEFDIETLSPTYRLLIGVPGRSNAFAISGRLGLGEHIIERARELVSSEDTRFEDVVSTLEETRRGMERKKDEADEVARRSQEMLRQAEEQLSRAKTMAEKEMETARKQAQGLVERTKMQTDMLLNELEELKKHKDKENFSQKTAQMGAGYRGRIQQLRDTADPVAAAGGDGYVLPRKLKTGDNVIISDIGARGAVISGPDADGQYMIQAGIIKTKVPATGLRLVEDTAKKKKQPLTPRKGGEQKAVRSASAELDLRGMDSAEAVIELDRFLSQAVLAGLTAVTIIHGKGTGVLRTAVNQHLKQRKKVVKSARPGTYGEGEHGVTVVELY